MEAAQMLMMPVTTGVAAPTAAGSDLPGLAAQAGSELFVALLAQQATGQAAAGTTGTAPALLPQVTTEPLQLSFETLFIGEPAEEPAEKDQPAPVPEHLSVSAEQLPLVYGQLAVLQLSSPSPQHHLENASAAAVDTEPEADLRLPAAIDSVDSERPGQLVQGAVDDLSETMQQRHGSSAGEHPAIKLVPDGGRELPQHAAAPAMNRPEPSDPLGDERTASPENQRQQQTNQGDGMARQAAVIRQQSGDSSAPEVAVPGRQTAVVAPQPFRFARTPDVAVAATDTGGRQEQPAQQQPQTSAGAEKPQMTAAPQPVSQQQSTEEGISEQAGEHHHAVAQTGRQLRTAPEQTVPEQHRAPADEQVARQVTERLSTYDIKQGSDRISLRLSPEHLGNLQLNLRMEEQGGLKLEIIAEHRGVREALLRQGDELRETLARQNIRIESFEVSTGTLGGQAEQQSKGWRQMNPEQRVYHAQYGAAARSGGGGGQDVSPQVRYFAPQYNATIDVRF